jgi:hypothetical protein
LVAAAPAVQKTPEIEEVLAGVLVHLDIHPMVVEPEAEYIKPLLK